MVVPGQEPRPEEELERQVRALREALERSEVNTAGVVAALDSFGNRVSAIDAEIRPVQVRMHAANMAHTNIDRTIDVAEDILVQLDIARRAQATISKGPNADLERYVEAMDQLRTTIRFFSLNTKFKSSRGVRNDIHELLTEVALMIEDEFRKLLGIYSKPIEPDRLFDYLPKLICTSNGAPEAVEEQLPQNSALYRNPTLIPPRILALLHDMAHHLIQQGNLQLCYEIYRDARASSLEQSLRKLGVGKLDNDNVKWMQWEALQTKIGNWNQFMQIALKVLLAGERDNCDLVFDGTTLNKDKCFVELAGNSFMTLLSFGDAVAKSKMSPEKLSVLLDMYGVMHELQSEVQVIFRGIYCYGMRRAASNLAESLAQTAKETLVDFVEAVEKDNENIILDGNVHPVTIYVLSCAKSLFVYQSTLETLKPFVTGSGSESQLAVATLKILQALQNNLDVRFKLYKDSALSYIFLMNNIHYIVMFVQRSEANDILGDDWIRRHRRMIKQIATQYQRAAWGKILEALSVPAIGGTGSSASDLSSNGVSRSMIKERFKSFNKQFEELHTIQSQWNIPDLELREDLKLAIAEVLLPAYQSFISRFRHLIERGKNPHKYMKHSREEMHQMLDDLFGGKQFAEEKQ